MLTEPGLVYHEEATDDDPHVDMRSIRVMFKNSKYNYQTDINGTREEIGDYFRGNSLFVCNFPDETKAIPYRIEFLSDEEDGQTVAMEL